MSAQLASPTTNLFLDIELSFLTVVLGEGQTILLTSLALSSILSRCGQVAMRKLSIAFTRKVGSLATMEEEGNEAVAIK